MNDSNITMNIVITIVNARWLKIYAIIPPLFTEPNVAYVVSVLYPSKTLMAMNFIV